MLTSLADVSCVTVEFGAVQLKLSRSAFFPELLEHDSLNCFAQVNLSLAYRSGFLESIWNSCVSLFSLGRPERLDAYAILSLYFSVLKSGHQGAIPGADEVQNFDLRNVTEFWDELRRGLVDKDSSIRKQAFYVLKTSLSIFSFGNDGSQRCSGRSPAALPGQDKSNAAVTKKERWANKEAKSLGVEEIKQSDEQCSSGQDRWKVFLLLYEMLQEFGTHLVEAAWAHQVLLLFESTPQSDYLNHISYRAFHAQMESVEGIFNWMTVLWERGFTQDNPQVRCLVMQSFLDIEWERYKGYAQMVPRGFVLGPLIRGLNDVVHHKDFGVGGVYNSEAIKGAERFFSNYARKLTIRERLHLVWSLASAAKQDSFGRPGLMTLAFCVASCACQSDTHDLPCGSAVNELAKCNGDTSIAVNTADFLDALWVLSERSKHHFNPKYRLKVCEQVIKAVASLTSAAEIPLNQLFNFISTIPRECTDSTGPLRGTVQKWLLQKKECSERNTLLDELIDFPTTFMKHTGIEGSYLYDDEDVGAWEAEARRWARTLLLVTSEEHHFKQIFTFLENCGNKLSEHSSTRKCADVKFFIIIICLIEELEVRQKKLVHQNNAIAGGGSDMTNGLEHHALTQMFEKSLLSVLENMVAFSKQSCSVFWLKNTDMDLPCSIKGKLGGPSQRRLATSITSSVLQCIWSMRCASSVVSWCNHYTSDVSFHSAFSFLWEFCWEVIQHCTYATETGAELHLAAYEALAYVLAALCTAPFSQFLDFVEAKQTNQTIILSLDLLATTFLGNINNLLTNGVLTRSRRAVLMCWKWLCVDSLLSISGCCDENESQMKTLGSFYSDSTLQSIFLDITESLENAGENSVVSILRCVRSVLGLIHLNRSHQNLSSLGISYEMMMQLVKSSWVLHLSCNKRRVAPIAALLSAILHPSIFPNLEMHQTNEEGPGPLKWFVETLLNEGSKSPRTIRLAALHLSGLWLMYPKTLRFYMEELKLLALYGSVAFDEDFEAELSENHEARFEVSMLAQSPDREFTEVFINTELYARVSVAALFHQLWKQIKEKSKLEAEEALQCGKLFLLKLLDSA
ncbi:unnamed protein product [Triticum turgidum subsp. durum]|uniref:Uncharacterized protein n=1 Tax=Triticum turgidum subsp. durum TaxID=4567 RepID=A0A9R0WWR9_TRITD|nr:unnamed protein product [Triticum turgidum subsp. durum]